MNKVLVSDIYKSSTLYLNQSIFVEGWIRTIRDSKSIGFIELNDGSHFKNLQIVFDETLSNFSEIAKLGVGAAVAIDGILLETPNAKQPFELKSNSIQIKGLCPAEYPLQKKRHSFEFLRTISHLRPRTNTFSAVFRVRSLLSFAIHKFFQENGFVNVHSPIITASDCEGAGEMFRVTTIDLNNLPRDASQKVDFSKDFFGRETNLTVSGQLSAEAYALAFKNVYTFGPTFRAENSNTARHAAEFWMIEPEMAFADLTDNMELAESMIKYIFSYVLENAADEMQFFNSLIDNTVLARLENVIESRFERITYSEAIEILTASDYKFEFPVKWGADLQTEHERYLTEKVFKKPVFVINYPKEIKAFYMRLNNDEKTVAAMDLLVPGVGEIIGGSQREERLDILDLRMAESNLQSENYWWYRDLRKFGGVKHTGFGLGLERALMYLTGMSNIRDVIPFPRTPKSAEF